jgi:hypothetical protein
MDRKSELHQREIKQVLRARCGWVSGAYVLGVFFGFCPFAMVSLTLAAAMGDGRWPPWAIGFVIGLMAVAALALVHAIGRFKCYTCGGSGCGKDHPASCARWVEGGPYLLEKPFDFASLYEQACGRGPARTKQELLRRCEEATLIYLRFEAEGIVDTEDAHAILERRFEQARALSEAICAWQDSQLDLLEQACAQRQQEQLRRAPALRRAAELNAADQRRASDDDAFLAWLRGDTEALRAGQAKFIEAAG